MAHPVSAWYTPTEKSSPRKPGMRLRLWAARPRVRRQRQRTRLRMRLRLCHRRLTLVPQEREAMTQIETTTRRYPRRIGTQSTWTPRSLRRASKRTLTPRKRSSRSRRLYRLSSRHLPMRRRKQRRMLSELLRPSSTSYTTSRQKKARRGQIMMTTRTPMTIRKRRMSWRPARRPRVRSEKHAPRWRWRRERPNDCVPPFAASWATSTPARRSYWTTFGGPTCKTARRVASRSRSAPRSSRTRRSSRGWAHCTSSRRSTCACLVY
mmetsp:Transcript_16458/g.50116  ORF Transcript_16458/g.50116 Transcript_16458/m.50116 type:complete len:265 (+) Transcript_16458:2481-3275(+)